MQESPSFWCVSLYLYVVVYILPTCLWSSVQIKWSSGRQNAQNCRRTTWTSQQVIRGTTRLNFPWTWVWLWEPFPPVLKCINLQNGQFPTLVFTLWKGDCSAGIGMSSHPQRQGMSKIPCHCTEECLQGVTPHDHERYLCAVRSAMTTLIHTPHYGGGLDVRCMVWSLTILWYIFSVVSIC